MLARPSAPWRLVLSSFDSLFVGKLLPNDPCVPSTVGRLTPCVVWMFLPVPSTLARLDGPEAAPLSEFWAMVEPSGLWIACCSGSLGPSSAAMRFNPVIA